MDVMLWGGGSMQLPVECNLASSRDLVSFTLVSPDGALPRQGLWNAMPGNGDVKVEGNVCLQECVLAITPTVAETLEDNEFWRKLHGHESCEIYRFMLFI